MDEKNAQDACFHVEQLFELAADGAASSRRVVVQEVPPDDGGPALSPMLAGDSTRNGFAVLEDFIQSFKFPTWARLNRHCGDV
eukprot:9375110-Pyramimonas_sp.AAC.1